MHISAGVTYHKDRLPYCQRLQILNTIIQRWQLNHILCLSGGPETTSRSPVASQGSACKSCLGNCVKIHAANKYAQYIDGECCSLHLCGRNKLKYHSSRFSARYFSASRLTHRCPNRSKHHDSRRPHAKFTFLPASLSLIRRPSTNTRQERGAWALYAC